MNDGSCNYEGADVRAQLIPNDDGDGWLAQCNCLRQFPGATYDGAIKLLEVHRAEADL